MSPFVMIDVIRWCVASETGKKTLKVVSMTGTLMILKIPTTHAEYNLAKKNATHQPIINKKGIKLFRASSRRRFP